MSAYVSTMIDVISTKLGKIVRIAARGIQDDGRMAEIAYSTMGNNDWEVREFGECGEFVTCLATLENIIFAGTNLGNIYKSNDLGDTWGVILSDVLDECSAMSTIPLTETIYASSGSKAISSNDGGKTWIDLGEMFN